MGLTLEEQERRAYISGDTERAALVAALVDGGEEDSCLADLEAVIDDLNERSHDLENPA